MDSTIQNCHIFCQYWRKSRPTNQITSRLCPNSSSPTVIIRCFCCSLVLAAAAHALRALAPLPLPLGSVAASLPLPLSPPPLFLPSE